MKTTLEMATALNIAMTTVTIINSTTLKPESGDERLACCHAVAEAHRPGGGKLSNE